MLSEHKQGGGAHKGILKDTHLYRSIVTQFFWGISPLCDVVVGGICRNVNEILENLEEDISEKWSWLLWWKVSSHPGIWFQPCIKNKPLILVYCLGNQDIMGSSLQTKGRHLSDASVCMGPVLIEWRLGICTAISSACLMAETSQWATYINIWLGNDFCLWAIETSEQFFNERQLSLCHL